MKTLSNLQEGKFDILEIGQVTICAATPTTAWKWTLPPNDGDAGQFLSTDGNGNTTWTGNGTPGTVTSVGLSAPSGQFTVSGSPVTGSGTIALTLNNSTGGGGIVLKDAPALTGVVTMSKRLDMTSTESGMLRLVNSVGGDYLYFGTSIGANTLAKIQHIGTINDLTNYIALGYFGGITGTRFYANADVELDRQGGVGGKLLLKSSDHTTSITTAASGSDWTLTLPQNNGDAGQVLSTDGGGVTSWVNQTGGGAGSGTVTSVGYAVDANYLSLSGTASPITVNGSFTIGLNSPQGTGGTIVLSTGPTITSLTALETVNTSTPLLVKNTASPGAFAEVEGLHVEAPNMVGLNSLRNRFGKSVSTAGDHGGLTYAHFGTDDATNQVQLAVGGGGSRGSLTLYNDGRASVLNTKLSFSGQEGFDYDEGTWTPALKYFDGGDLAIVSPSATLSNVLANGTYIRNGKMVTLFFDYLFDMNDGDAKATVGNRWVFLSGVPFQCNQSTGGSNFTSRGWCTESDYPNGIADTGFKAPLASTYPGPFQPTIWGDGESVSLGIQTVINPHLVNWTSDGNHVLIFSDNVYDVSTIVLPGPAYASNQCVSNWNVLAGSTYNGNRLKGTVSYFIA